MGKNNVRITHKESHKVPNSQVKGIINEKKMEQFKANHTIDNNNENESYLSNFFYYLLTDRRSSNFINWIVRIVIGFVTTTYVVVPDTVQGAVGYWTTYLFLLSFIDFWKKEK